MKKEIILITAMLALILLLAISDIKAQDSSYVYLVRDSAQLITTDKIIVSAEYVNVLLEPIPGKVTRWTITRVGEEPPIVPPVVTTVNNTELTFTGVWEHPSGTWGTISHSSTVGATAKYTFTGGRIEVFGTKASHHGLLGYTINAGLEKTVNLNSTDRQDGVLLIDQIVPQGLNTITLRCVSNTVLIDYLRITK